MNGETLTIGEAADRLGVHRNRVSALVRSGRLPATRQGRAVLVRLADLEALERRTCERCGRPFKATDTRRRFCGAVCRMATAYDAHKARHPATRPPGRPGPPPADPATLRKALYRLADR